MTCLGEMSFSFENNVYFSVIFWYFCEYQIGHTVCVLSLTRPSRMGQHMANLGKMPFSLKNNVYFAVIFWYFYKYQIGHTVCVIQIFNPYWFLCLMFYKHYWEIFLLKYLIVNKVNISMCNISLYLSQ